jgi:uncharacterized protein DUF1761
MAATNVLAIAAAAVLAFVFSAVYYGALATTAAQYSAAWAEQSGTPIVTVAFELGKGLLLALVVAGMVRAVGIDNLAGALAFAIVLWVCFPVLLLAGSVIHENVAWRLAAIHAGDWLAKLAIVAVVVTIWS